MERTQTINVKEFPSSIWDRVLILKIKDRTTVKEILVRALESYLAREENK